MAGMNAGAETEVSSKPLFGTAQGQHRNNSVNS